jgi:hypothetical protein
MGLVHWPIIENPFKPGSVFASFTRVVPGMALQPSNEACQLQGATLHKRWSDLS